MPAPDRMVRVNEILKREIADLLEKEKLMDGEYLVSVTGVSTSPNLRNAFVGISVLGGNEQIERDILRSLYKRRKELQRIIAHDLKLKYTPVLHFKTDRNIEAGDKVLQILKGLENDETHDS
ncbi:MAG: ribosome-binding factor A [Lentisphaerae bacterium GWF2_45_14]|nr:MAG: ribosome-binding factor A [Lentisphaerae bacterium GWF2_45_14]